MKMLAATISLMLFSIFVQGQNKNCAQKSMLLEKAFQRKSIKLLTVFLDDWHNKSIASKMNAKNRDSISSIIYSIHAALFDPFSYKNFGWPESDRTRFTGAKYIVIQDNIPFTLSKDVDTLDMEDHVYTDTLFHFRPDIKFKGVKTLFMLDEYRCVAQNFIQANTIEKEMEFYDKLNFMSPALKTSMRKDWTAIFTQPAIIGITICHDRLAIVDYYLASNGMRSMLRLENGRWEIKNTIELWIED
ncbi:hypothetical protein [Chryseolinea lacunae]|uniref:DUF3828 domain-containing protein n=1 Tax=Chryseolinea lacunae TaxID=2801331 RepID=A0ABS1KWJ4_9BACT|nr:hypothetical protein [Chryseolinea lacunae]MBL0743836.1 hypothetical protein [Chryseolinea lacunae]